MTGALGEAVAVGWVKRSETHLHQWAPPLMPGAPRCPDADSTNAGCSVTVSLEGFLLDDGLGLVGFTQRLAKLLASLGEYK